MHRSSPSVAALASALAKAQLELVNPEKTLTGIVPADRSGQGERPFRYAGLSSGLDIIRKTLGGHELAVMQTTEPHPESGTIKLTTVLAHASGEWIASEWPVCPISDVNSPRRMGAALTYARRYSLFALVGVAGEDDLDAPDLAALAPGPNRAQASPNSGNHFASKRMTPAPVLDAAASVELRERFVQEIGDLASEADATAWASKVMAAKNTLTVEDARLLEDAFCAQLTTLRSDAKSSIPTVAAPESAPIIDGRSTGEPQAADRTARRKRTRLVEKSSNVLATPSEKIDKSTLTIAVPRRFRDKHHLRLVAAQRCLICMRKPCDPHHLSFAQPRALGRKVSDEYTVPLCRSHHRELHRSGNERQWWARRAIEPMAVANRLWAQSRGIIAPSVPPGV